MRPSNTPLLTVGERIFPVRLSCTLAARRGIQELRPFSAFREMEPSGFMVLDGLEQDVHRLNPLGCHGSDKLQFADNLESVSGLAHDYRTVRYFSFWNWDVLLKPVRSEPDFLEGFRRNGLWICQYLLIDLS